MSVDMEKTQQLETSSPVVLGGLPRVNLLPPEISAEHTLRTTKFVSGGAVLAVVAALGAGWLLSSWQVSQAQDELAAEQSTAQQLKAEEGKYAEVPRVLNAIESTKQAQAQAMAQDISWYQELDQVSAEFPQGLILTKLTVASNATATTTDTNPLATPGTIGKLTIEGLSPTYNNHADWLDALARHKGFVDPFYTTADLAKEDKLKKNMVKTMTTVSYTADLLNHAHDRKAQ